MKFSETVNTWPTKPNGQPDIVGIRIFLMDTVRQLQCLSYELSMKFAHRPAEVFELRRFIVDEGIENLREQDEMLVIGALDFYRLERLIPILTECEILEIVLQFVFGFAQFADAAVTLQSVEVVYKRFRKDIAGTN